MALTVPESVNAANLTGSYTLNKTVSDSTDSVLQFQGVSWLLRKTISMMSVTVHLKQWTDEDGVTILNTESESAGGMRKSDIRKLDWTDNETNDTLFGKISVKMRVIKFGELPDDLDPWLKEDWDDEVVNGSVLQSATTSLQNGWKAAQIVGYGLKDGVRRQMRKVVVTKGSEQRKVTIFYDWVGPLEI